MPKPWKRALQTGDTDKNETGTGDPVEIALVTAEIGHVPELDLHGLTAEEARRELAAFLENEHAEGVPGVRIMHGKGSGKLQDVVLDYLAGAKGKGIVTAYRSPTDRSMQGAFVIVALSKE